MDTAQEFIDALGKIRPALPALLGDDWPTFEQHLDDYLQELERAADDDARQGLIDELRILFFDYPAAEQALRAAMSTESAAPAAMPEVKGIRPAGEASETAASTVVRYTDISCPERVWIDAERVTAVVRLTLQPSTLSPDVQALQLRIDLPVLVRVNAPSFEILNGRQREMTLYSDRDSEISVDLKPVAVGPTRITFDFLQGGNPIGTASVQVEVVAESVPHSAEARLERLLRFDPGAPAPDLVLYVAYEPVDGAPHYVFTLYQADKTQGDIFQPVPVHASPLDYTRDLYNSLVGLTLSQENAGALNDQIREIGQNLWHDLIPDRLRRLFLDNRSAWAGKTMLLLSDEPYIPWELVWPFDVKTSWDADAPWAESLNLTRWLRSDAVSAGYDGPASTLKLASIACLAPSDKNLSSVDVERQYIQAVVERFKLRNVTPPSLQRQAVLDLLAQGDYSWLHVATHGDYSETNPDQDAAIWLEGSDYLTPRNFVGAKILGSIYRTRPGFVFNACYGGRQAWSLTRLGGWANRLVGAGAGLYLAPMWTVRDDLAHAFSEAFYTELLDGNTAAQALQAGRQAAKQDGNPTWLAYSLYAHPNARLSLQPSSGSHP